MPKLTKLNLGCNYSVYKEHYPERNIFNFLCEKIWIVFHQKEYLKLDTSYKDLKIEETAIIMAKGILSGIDEMDGKYIDKEYVKQSLRKWLARRTLET